MPRRLGAEIQTIRKRRGLSQEQLAELTDLDAMTIAFIEQGRREPRLKTLKRIADALGVRVKDLIPF